MIIFQKYIWFYDYGYTLLINIEFYIYTYLYTILSILGHYNIKEDLVRDNVKVPLSSFKSTSERKMQQSPISVCDQAYIIVITLLITSINFVLNSEPRPWRIQSRRSC